METGQDTTVSTERTNEYFEEQLNINSVKTTSRKSNINLNMMQPDVSNLSQICLVMEYFETDLDQIFKYNIEFKENHMLKIAYNTLCAMAFMHEANVMHRDIKSANIILNSDCVARICDLGLSRSMPITSHQDEAMSTMSVRDQANKFLIDKEIRKIYKMQNDDLQDL